MIGGVLSDDALSLQLSHTYYDLEMMTGEDTRDQRYRPTATASRFEIHGDVIDRVCATRMSRDDSFLSTLTVHTRYERC